MRRPETRSWTSWKGSGATKSQPFGGGPSAPSGASTVKKHGGSGAEVKTGPPGPGRRLPPTAPAVHHRHGAARRPFPARELRGRSAPARRNGGIAPLRSSDATCCPPARLDHCGRRDDKYSMAARLSIAVAVGGQPSQCAAGGRHTPPPASAHDDGDDTKRGSARHVVAERGGVAAQLRVTRAEHRERRVRMLNKNDCVNFTRANPAPAREKLHQQRVACADEQEPLRIIGAHR